jgi:hypothetical protein
MVTLSIAVVRMRIVTSSVSMTVPVAIAYSDPKSVSSLEVLILIAVTFRHCHDCDC